MGTKGVVTIIAIFLLLAGALNSFFIIDQTQQALVLRFGKPVNIITEPGLQFKVPFVDAVEVYDNRILVLNAEPKAVILQDQDRLIVDAYVTYRIDDPLTFYQAVRSERIMNQRLEQLLETSLREVMGREDLSTLLSPKRSEIMDNIRDNVSRLATGKSLVVRGEVVPVEELPAAQAVQEDVADAVTNDFAVAEVREDSEVVTPKERSGFGIQIVDVRVMRTDLPKQTSDPIYNRMRSDRQKVAERFRAEGAKESQIIRSEADRERTVLIAEAQRKAATIRGEGDGVATKIFADSFGKDTEFFEFYRAMEAYKKSLNNDDTTVILSPDNNFLKFLER